MNIIDFTKIFTADTRQLFAILMGLLLGLTYLIVPLAMWKRTRKIVEPRRPAKRAREPKQDSLRWQNQDRIRSGEREGTSYVLSTQANHWLRKRRRPRSWLRLGADGRKFTQGPNDPGSSELRGPENV